MKENIGFKMLCVNMKMSFIYFSQIPIYFISSNIIYQVIVATVHSWRSTYPRHFTFIKYYLKNMNRNYAEEQLTGCADHEEA